MIELYFVARFRYTSAELLSSLHSSTLKKMKDCIGLIVNQIWLPSFIYCIWCFGIRFSISFQGKTDLI